MQLVRNMLLNFLIKKIKPVEYRFFLWDISFGIEDIRLATIIKNSWRFLLESEKC